MTRVLIKLIVVIFIFAVNICAAYLYDREPELLSSDLRLAAMGNLDLAVIGWDNEVSAYDFGESPAGVIEDNSGKSMVYVPGVYGCTRFDSLPGSEWNGYALSALGIVKIKSRFATGFTYSRRGADHIYEYVYGPYTEYQDHRDYDSHFGSLITAYRISSCFTLGFRGSYSKSATQWQYDPYTDEDYDDIYTYEPSVLIQPVNLHWHFAFKYELNKHRWEPTIHDFTLPIIYSSPQLRLGIKGGLGTTPYDGPLRKSLKLRSIYQISAGRGAVNLGLLFAYASPPFVEDLTYLWWSEGWETDYGIGIAYQHETLWQIGLQYKRKIHKTKTYWEWEEYSYAMHQQSIHCGAEISLLKNIPIRLGYVNVSYDYPYAFYNDPAYDIITTGFGVRIPRAKIEIDFAYNIEFIDRSGYYIYETFLDKDHTLGLSGRLIF